MHNRMDNNAKPQREVDSAHAPNQRAIMVVDTKQKLPSIKLKKDNEGYLVTSESFGIEAVIEGRVGMFSPILPQGSRVPLSFTKRYFPIEDFQKMIKVVCFKGEHPVAAHNTKLGEFVVSGLLVRSKLDSRGIEITFTINRVGVILVDALEVENPDNHLKIKLDYVDKKTGLVRDVAKGVVKEVLGIFLPSGKS